MKNKVYIRVALIWIVIAVGAISSVLFIQDRPNTFQDIDPYVTSEVSYANGEHATFEDGQFGIVDKNDVVTVHIQLPNERFYENSTLMFYDYSAVTKIFFDGRVLSSYGEDLAEKGMMIGNRNFVIPIPDSAWGKEITIELKVVENNAFSSLSRLKVFPSEKTSLYYIGTDPLGFIVSITMFMVGVIGLFSLFFSGFHGQGFVAGMYLFIAQVTISLWMMINKNIIYMFGADAYFWQPLEYITGYSSSIPLLLFLMIMSKSRPKWSKAFHVSAIIASLFVIVASILNFTNVVHFDSFMYVGAALLIIYGCMTIGYVFTSKNRNPATTHLMKSGVSFFVITVIYAVLIRSLPKYSTLINYNSLPSFIPLGLLILLSCLVGSLGISLFDQHQEHTTVQIQAKALNDVLDATPAGIVQMRPDENYTILAANDVAYEIMGFTKEELRTHKPNSPFERLKDSERKHLREIVDEVVKENKTTGEKEFTTIDANNNKKTFMLRYFYDIEGSGNVTGNLIDITDRKEMEERLKSAQELNELALEQSGKLFFNIDVRTRTMTMSEDMSKQLGLPISIDHVPESLIHDNLVLQESIPTYEHMFERIYAGDPNGEAIVGSYLNQDITKITWYKMNFVSIFDQDHHPINSIITCEDITEQYKSELASKWKQASIALIPEKQYTITTYDLTSELLVDQTGELFDRVPEFVRTLEKSLAYVSSSFVYKDDLKEWYAFFNKERFLKNYYDGKPNDYLEFRSLQRGVSYRWTSVTTSMVEAPFNNHIMLQLLIVDIEDSKNNVVQQQVNTKQMQKELDDQRIRILIKQMRPHFLYNTLSSIQAVVKFDPDYAYQLIYDFTIYLRSNLKALSNDKPIPFTDELDNINSYINIEKMRFGENFKLITELECEDFKVVPLSVQHFVENAARHGLYEKDEEDDSSIIIRSKETEDNYIVEVEDNGVGFDVDAVLNADNNSLGIKNNIVRLKTLMNADVEITSKIDVGTLVRITIPKANKED